MKLQKGNKIIVIPDGSEDVTKNEIVLDKLILNDRVYYRDYLNRIWTDGPTLVGIIRVIDKSGVKVEEYIFFNTN